MGIFLLLLALGALAIAFILFGLELEDKGHSRWSVVMYILALLCAILLWFINEVT